MFNNLPAARNVISIFTASGDHVATVEHDGLILLLGGSFSAWNVVNEGHVDLGGTTSQVGGTMVTNWSCNIGEMVQALRMCSMRDCALYCTSR